MAEVTSWSRAPETGGASLLTPGEIMQLPPDCMKSSLGRRDAPQIRAKKARYFEDRRFLWIAVVAPPEPEQGHADDAGLIHLVILPAIDPIHRRCRVGAVDKLQMRQNAGAAPGAPDLAEHCRSPEKDGRTGARICEMILDDEREDCRNGNGSPSEADGAGGPDRPRWTKR